MRDWDILIPISFIILVDSITDMESEKVNPESPAAEIYSSS